MRTALAAIAGAALALGAVPAPAKAPAKAKKHALRLTLRATGTHGTLSGKPFGKGKVTIEREPPRYYLMTWKFPHGTIVLLATIPESAEGVCRANACSWVIGGGTGRYKKATGSGVLTGTIDGKAWNVVAQKSVTF